MSSLTGVTLDWWTRNDTHYGFQWGNASIFTIDFNNPNLIAAGKALAPGLLRLGMNELLHSALWPRAHSQVDRPSTLFHSTGTARARLAEMDRILLTTARRFDLDSVFFAKLQVRPYIYGCLTRQRVQDILAFGRATGLHITLGINACWGRMGQDKPLDFTNAVQLLKYLASLEPEVIAPLKGFEFGRRPD